MVAVCRRGLRFKPRGRSLFDHLDRGEATRSADGDPLSLPATDPAENILGMDETAGCPG